MLPYSGCDKENVATKKLNKDIPCRYSINVARSHSKERKQTYFRGESTVSIFCKELRKTAQDILNTEIKSMQPLSKEEQEIYDKAKYCHICKKVFDKKKN